MEAKEVSWLSGISVTLRDTVIEFSLNYYIFCKLILQRLSMDQKLDGTERITKQWGEQRLSDMLGKESTVVSE